MFKQVEPALQSEDEYTKLLLRERRQHLQSLASSYAQQKISPSEYESCRKSLLQAISELVIVERNTLQPEPRSAREPRRVQLTKQTEEDLAVEPGNSSL